jgi:hypothetical protein
MEPDDVITTLPVDATATIGQFIDTTPRDEYGFTTTIPVVANADVGNPITDLSEARSRRLARRQQRERDRLLLIIVAALVLFVVVA